MDILHLMANTAPIPTRRLPHALHISASAFRTRAWLRGIVFVITLFTLSLSGAAAAVMLFGTRTVRWQAFTVDMHMVPASRGMTRIVLVPLGEVHARTHRAPVEMRIELTGLSFDRLRRMVTAPQPRNQLERDFKKFAREEMVRFSVRLVILGALGGMLAALVLRAARKRIWWISAAIGASGVGALLLVTLRTFDPGAFNEPVYTGSLRQANTVIGLARNALDNAEALSDRLRTVAVNLNALYGRIGAAEVNPVPENDTIRVLHITDLHNNTAAVTFVRELAVRFRVHVVIDTGDLTDYGSPVESELSGPLGRLSMPYLFAAGNHDSQTTVRGVAAHPNATILDGQVVRVAGLTVVGLPDPSSRRPGIGDVNTPEDRLKAEGQRLLGEIDKMEAPPDLVCVHNPRMAQPLYGKVPLVLAGHMHRAYLEEHGETVVCNAGTTGAAGVRYLDRAGGVPFSAALLTFSKETHPRLLYIDLITLRGSLDEYSIERRTFTQRAPAEPGPATPPAASTPADAR